MFKKRFYLSAIFNVLLFAFVLVFMHKTTGILNFLDSQINKVSGSGQNNEFVSYPVYKNRASLFDDLPIDNNDIVFVGDSITQRNEWGELFHSINVKNRGIDSDTVEGIMRRIKQISQGKPKQVFIDIGINDIYHKRDYNYVLNKYKQLISEISTTSPNTEIYIESLLPVNNSTYHHPINNNDVIKFNMRLKKLSTSLGVNYIETYNEFISKDKKELDAKYTNDGVHPNGNGYMKLKHILSKYIDL